MANDVRGEGAAACLKALVRHAAEAEARHVPFRCAGGRKGEDGRPGSREDTQKGIHAIGNTVPARREGRALTGLLRVPHPPMHVIEALVLWEAAAPAGEHTQTHMQRDKGGARPGTAGEGGENGDARS